MSPEIAMRRLSAVFLAVLATAMVWQFHDQSWWAPDDGAYAHIAERLLKGEVLNGSIYDIHLGLVHFVHAAAFKLFGTTMVGLRYPLALLTILQSLLVLWLLRDHDWLGALAGGIAMAALTFVQFLNPSANWYALFATIVLIAATAGLPTGVRGRYLVLGALAMVVIMFRQLTGGIVAIGLVTWLLTEEQHRSSFGKPMLARAVLGVCGFVLGLYMLKTASLLSVILFGIWPIGLIVLAWRRTVMPDRAVARMAVQLLSGAAIALAPLVLYHLMHGSLYGWVDDTVLSAFRLTALPFMDQASYLYLPLVAVGAMMQQMEVGAIVNGLFWLALLAAPVVLGAIVVGRALRDGAPVPVLAHMAVFFALVSAHYEIAIYLFYSAALTLCGLVAVSGERGRRGQTAASLAVLLLAGVGLWSHAGQPLTRGLTGIATGERLSVPATPMDHRVGLRVAAADRRFYGWLIPLIEQNSRPDDSILAMPAHPELYFMTGRRNPTRFFNSALGLLDAEDVQLLLSTLVIDPPAMVVFNSRDKYVTPAVETVMTRVRATYRRIALRDGVEVYARSR